MNPTDPPETFRTRRSSPRWMNEINLWPLRLSSLGLCQPCILAAGPASIRKHEGEDRQVLVGQRYGSGVVRVRRGFYCELCSLLLLRQVVNAGEMKPVIYSNHFFFFFTQLEDTPASFCRSRSFCWRKIFSVSISGRHKKEFRKLYVDQLLPDCWR